MKVLAAVALLSVALVSTSSPKADAPTGFDNKSNGMVDEATHQADQAKFDDTETVADGLGPLYNAQSCRECHQNPTSGGTSQVAELRVGAITARVRPEREDLENSITAPGSTTGLIRHSAVDGGNGTLDRRYQPPQLLRAACTRNGSRRTTTS